MQLVQFAHGVIENGGDDSPMAMPGRSRIALGQTEARNKMFAVSIECESQVHSRGIVFAAGKAVILFQLMRARSVPCSLEFSCHKGCIVTDWTAS